MKKYIESNQSELEVILQRPAVDSSLNTKVREVMDRVKKEGDVALRFYSKKFDNCEIKDFRQFVKDADVSDSLKKALKKAKKNIEDFHSLQKPETEVLEKEGMMLKRIPVPISPVGIYIPGGSAPLFSTVLMLAIPATIAGCEEIVLCTPPPLNPAVAYAAALCGIEKVYTVGGAQAIAAMAYGTETVPKCAKIFGPGNNWVSEAKKIAASENTAIDMMAGPSEVMVVVDETSDPVFAASDLLSQAEHGPTSQVILVFRGNTEAGNAFISKVEKEIEDMLPDLPRRNIIKQSLSASFSIVVESTEKAINIINMYCPEHLIINTSDCDELVEHVKTAGSVFAGPWSPESAGDYASGTNHTLPTGGWGKSCSGVSVDSFMRKMTIQKISREGLENLSFTIMKMAEEEGLEAHKNAVAVRMEKNAD